jgi:hypothetical protein
VIYSWRSTFIICAQNVLHEIQCTPRHVSSWTTASLQSCRGDCEWSDSHPQWDVPLRCQQELHTQGFLGVPHKQKSQIVQVRRSWRPCSGSCSADPSVMIGVVENISHSEAKVCRSTIMHVQHSFSWSHKLNVSRHMLLWTFFLVLVC